MEKQTNKFISLKEATKYCDYSIEYLNLRIRQGKLKAEKFGRNWMTKKEWVKEYVERYNNRNNYKDEYISLREATDISNYSIEYLNLRIRQGKLKAEKFGRNWMTKRRWIKEYLRKVKKYKKTTGKKLKKNIIPDNLPMGDFNELSPSCLVGSQRKIVFFQSMLISLMIFFIISISIFFCFNLFQGQTPSEILVRTESVILAGNAKIIMSLGNTIIIFEDYFKRAYHRAIVFKKRLAGTFKKIAINLNLLFFQEEEFSKIDIPEEKKVPVPGDKKGMVVIPSSGSNEDFKKEIKSAFSDEVKIEQEDDSSGIIIPIFKEKKGDEYMYVLVPIAE